MAPTDQPSMRQELDDLRSDIRKWIKGDEAEEKLSSSRLYEDALSRHHAGTGEWLWSHESFQSWDNTNANGVNPPLGLVAAPGSGKTVLAAVIAKHLRDRGEKVAIFFCSYYDNRRSSAEFALQSLALQLLDFNTSIPDSLTELYLRDRELKQDKLDGIDTAAGVVASLSKTIPKIHIVVDGLDELRQWEAASSWFQYLWKATSTGTTKWLVTSRQDQLIRTALHNSRAAVLEVSEQHVRSDVEAFLVEEGVLADTGVASLEDLNLEVDGNFRWAALLLETVKNAEDKSRRAIIKIIKQFPTGLRHLYLRTLEQRLAQLGSSERKLARKLIAFIVAAEQPLRLKELAHALQVKKRLSQESIEQLGSHLVIFEIDSASLENPVVRFPHKTVYDFFTYTQDDFDPPATVRRFFTTKSNAHAELGKACFDYINSPRYDEAVNVTAMLDDDKHVFLRYSAAYWHHHLDQAGEAGSSMKGRIQAFMENPRFWTCVATQSYIAPFLFGRYDKAGRTGYNYSSGLDRRAPEAARVGWGYPLPRFMTHDRAKAFLSFIVQWHQILNTWPDRIQHCYMGVGWEHKWPAFRKWVEINSTTQTSILPDDDALNVNARQVVQTKLTTRPCLILSQIFNARMLDPEEWELSRPQAHTCSFCQKGMVTTAEHTKDPSPQDIQPSAVALDKAALRDILTQSSQHLLKRSKRKGHDWTLEDIGMNIAPNRSAHSLECLAVLHTRDVRHIMTYQDDNDSDSGYHSEEDDSDDQSDSAPNENNSQDEEEEDAAGDEESDNNDPDEDEDDEDEDDDESTADAMEIPPMTEYCIVLYRKGLSPLLHAWTSRLVTTPRCAFDAVHRQIVWTAEPGQLCMANMNGTSIERTSFEEPHDIGRKMISMYRDVHFSDDGEQLWYLLKTVQEDDQGWQHCLSVVRFNIDRSGPETLQLGLQAKRTITYCSTGSIRLPGILTTWSNDHLFLALPPLASMPKIIRVPLSATSSSLPMFETLCNPIFFPSSTLSRNPALYHLSMNSSDLLMLQLDPEETLKDDVACKVQNYPEYGCGQQYPSIRGDEVMQDDMRQITWQVDREKGWREWNEELDMKSEEYMKLVSSASNSLRGTYVDSRKSFRVTIRTSLDWRRQAFLTCS